MSIRLKKAMGWGMPYDEFLATTTLVLDEDEYLGDTLEAVLPSNVKYEGDNNFCRQLYSDICGAAGLGNLFVIIGHADESETVLIFPTEEYQKQWYRRDDDLDHVFETGHLADNEFPAHETLYLTEPPYPFGNLWMDHNGIEIPITNTQEARLDPGLVPGIPEVMRWWLLRYQVFDLAGLAKLRPLRAKWWS